MSDTKALLVNARKAIDSGDFEAALTLAANAASKDPDNIMAKVFIGVAASNAGKFEQAFDALRAAAAKDSSNLTVAQGIVALHEKCSSSTNPNSTQCLHNEQASTLLADSYAKVLAQPFKGERGKHFDRAHRFLRFAMLTQWTTLTAACATEIERIMNEVGHDTAPNEFYELVEFLTCTCVWSLNAHKCATERTAFIKLITLAFQVLHFSPRESRREFFAKDGTRLRNLSAIDEEKLEYSRLYFSIEFLGRELGALVCDCDAIVALLKDRRTQAIEMHNKEQAALLKARKIDEESMRLAVESDTPLFFNFQLAFFILKLRLEALLALYFDCNDSSVQLDEDALCKAKDQFDMIRAWLDTSNATVFDYHRKSFVDKPAEQLSAAIQLSLRVVELQFTLFRCDLEPINSAVDEIWSLHAENGNLTALLESDLLLDYVFIAFAAYYVSQFDRANFCLLQFQKKLAARAAASQHVAMAGSIDQLSRYAEWLSSWLRLSPFIDLPDSVAINGKELLAFLGYEADQKRFNAALTGIEKSALLLHHSLVVTDALVSANQFEPAQLAIATIRQRFDCRPSRIAKELLDLLAAFVDYAGECVATESDSFSREPPPFTLVETKNLVPFYSYGVYLRGRLLFAYGNRLRKGDSAADGEFKTLSEIARQASFLLRQISLVNPYYAPPFIWLARCNDLESFAVARLADSDSKVDRTSLVADAKRVKRDAASNYVRAFKMFEKCKGTAHSIHRPAFVTDLLDLLDSIGNAADEVLVLRILITKSDNQLQAASVDRKSLLIRLTSRLTTFGFGGQAARADSEALKELVQELLAGLRTRPKDYELWQSLGFAYEAHRNSSHAQKAFARAVQLEPNASLSLFKLGMLQTAAGAYGEACSSLVSLMHSLKGEQRSESWLRTLGLVGLAKLHFEVVRTSAPDDYGKRVGNLWFSLCCALRAAEAEVHQFVSLWSLIGCVSFELFRVLQRYDKSGLEFLFPHFNRVLDKDRSPVLVSLKAASAGQRLLECARQCGSTVAMDDVLHGLLLGDAGAEWCVIDERSVAALLRVSEASFVRALRLSRGLLPDLWHDLSIVLSFSELKQPAERCALRSVAIADRFAAIRLRGDVRLPQRSGTCWMQLGNTLKSRPSDSDLLSHFCLNKAIQTQPQFWLASCALSSFHHARGSITEAETVLDAVPLISDSSFSTWFCRSLLGVAGDRESKQDVLSTFFHAFSSVLAPLVDQKSGRATVEKRKTEFPFDLVQSSRPALFAYVIHFYRSVHVRQLVENADNHCVLLSNALSSYLHVCVDDPVANVLSGMVSGLQGQPRAALLAFEKAERLLGRFVKNVDSEKDGCAKTVACLLRQAALCKLQLYNVQPNRLDLDPVIPDEAACAVANCKTEADAIALADQLSVIMSFLSDRCAVDATAVASAFSFALKWCGSNRTEKQPLFEVKLKYANAVFHLRRGELQQAKVGLLQCLQSPLLNDPGLQASDVEYYALKCQVLAAMSNLLVASEGNSDQQEHAALLDGTLSEIEATISVAMQWRLRHPATSISSIALNDRVAEYFTLLHRKRLVLLGLGLHGPAGGGEECRNKFNNLLATHSLLMHAVHTSPDCYALWSLIREVQCQIADHELVPDRFSWLSLAYTASTNALVTFDADVRLTLSEKRRQFLTTVLKSNWKKYYTLQEEHIEVINGIVGYFSTVDASDEEIIEHRKYWASLLRRRLSAFVHYYPAALEPNRKRFTELLGSLKANA